MHSILAFSSAGIAILATAVGTLLVGIGTLVAAVKGRGEIIEVKAITNGRTDRMQKRIEELIELMGKHGITVPDQKDEE